MDINDPALLAVSCRFTLAVKATSHILPSLGGSSMAFVVSKHHLNIPLFEQMTRDGSSFP